MARVLDPALREACSTWQDLRGDETFVREADLRPRLQPHADDLFVAAVDGEEQGPLSFRVVALGRHLREELQRSFESDQETGEALGGAQESAYRRAAQSRSPTYERARFSFGDGPTMLFERLLLPVSDDARRVTHIVGLVRFAHVPP